ncbi:MAG: methyltransferase domain-containing protein, partial [Syntrophobacteraceae bacterium]
GGPPDLVISQHTMEHLQNPKETLALLFDKVKEGCVFLLEFPCLDPLLQKYRFDQIFHQHLQYFSIGSALKLLDEIGAELIDYTFNFNYWGALLLAFRKPGRTGKTAVERKQSSWITPDEILRRYAFFQKQMAMTLECCLDTRRTMDVCGYGAALMLPVLAYHMKTDFEWLACVVDDDPSKQDKGYVNLPVKIQSPHGIDFQNSAILLTALDNRRPILRKLAAIGPKMILNPLCIT